MILCGWSDLTEESGVRVIGRTAKKKKKKTTLVLVALCATSTMDDRFAASASRAWDDEEDYEIIQGIESARSADNPQEIRVDFRTGPGGDDGAAVQLLVIAMETAAACLCSQLLLPGARAEEDGGKGGRVRDLIAEFSLTVKSIRFTLAQ